MEKGQSIMKLVIRDIMKKKTVKEALQYLHKELFKTLLRKFPLIHFSDETQNAITSIVQEFVEAIFENLFTG